MSELLASNFVQLMVGLAGAAAVYGGIRADLRAMKSNIDRMQRQIDDHILLHIKRG